MTFRVMPARNRAHISFRVHAAMALLLLALIPCTAAHAAKPRPPKPENAFALRIAVDNGRTSVRTGDRLTYTTKISNTGAGDSPDLRITQTLVSGLTFVSATPKAKAGGGKVTWTRSLPAGETGQFSVTVEVGQVPAHLQRLAVVACASREDDDRPIVCAAHSDLLPSAEKLQTPGSGPGMWITIGVISALLLAVGGFFGRRALKREEAPMSPVPADQ